MQRPVATMSFEEYCRSQTWRTIRGAFLRKPDLACELCGATDLVDVVADRCGMERVGKPSSLDEALWDHVHVFCWTHLVWYSRVEADIQRTHEVAHAVLEHTTRGVAPALLSVYAGIDRSLVAQHCVAVSKALLAEYDRCLPGEVT